MDGKERVGGVSALNNPPRDGEGDRAAKRGGGGGPSPTLRRPEVYEARRARREMSLPEILLWQRLRGALNGIRFRKQHPIAGYRADFYCPAAKLVIEVDGIAHDMGDRPARDERRKRDLEERGYEVLRVPAADVLKDADGVAQAIVTFAQSSLGRGRGPAKLVEGMSGQAEAASPLHHAFGMVPLPMNGEDLR